MPDPKDNQKASGDVHPPEIETERDSRAGEPGVPGARGRAREPEDETPAGESVDKAGMRSDKDAPASGRDQGGKA